MLVRALILAALATLVFAPTAGAKPSARALLVGCERGLEEAERAAVFEGQMRAVPGARRLQMRFRLQVRSPDTDGWSALSAPGWGTWVTAASGTSRYVYTKRIENLLVPASYRVQLRFRWLDADGDTIERAKRYSPACRQPDPRADLGVRSLGVQPAGVPARRRYVAFVRNAGRTASEATTLLVTAGGVLLPEAPVGPLAPGEGVLISVEGPACRAGAEVTAEIDPDETVDERDELDNRLTRSC